MINGKSKPFAARAATHGCQRRLRVRLGVRTVERSTTMRWLSSALSLFRNSREIYAETKETNWDDFHSRGEEFAKLVDDDLRARRARMTARIKGASNQGGMSGYIL